MAQTLLIPETQDRLRRRDPILHRSIHQFDRAVYDPHHYSGVILIDGREVCQTLQCAHCRAHFLNVKVPGKERGWCMRCNKPVCPNPACDDCTDFEDWLISVEKNLPPGHRTIRAAVRGEVPTTLIGKNKAAADVV